MGGEQTEFFDSLENIQEKLQQSVDEEKERYGNER